MFDISDPNNPIQIWEYDTYTPNDHDSYKGAWGVYPYLPSGNIIVSDMQTGLYIIDLNLSTTYTFEGSTENSIYPNPTTNSFSINSEAEKIIIYNSSGVKVKEEILSKNQNTIFRDKLANGLYFYSINQDGKNIKSGKVIFR